MKKISFLILFLCLLIPSFSFSATGTPFTSAIASGNWNDGATWGNASPGSKGTDWPGTAGDVVTIAAGHTVLYNVSETNELGAMTINGTLTFSTSANTLLSFGHVDLTIGSTGTLNVGTSGAGIIPKTQTAALAWNTTSANAKGINIAAGGILNVYGDPDYYGSSDSTTLASNWTSGQTLTVVGDFTTKWNVNDCITVHKGTTYSNYNTDVQRFTIASRTLNGSNTDIVINEAAPGVTFYATGDVINVTRNVALYKVGNGTNLGPVIGTYVTNGPRVTDANTATGKISVYDSIWTGWDRIGFAIGANLTRNTIRGSNNYGIYSGLSHNISGNLYSNNYAIGSSSAFKYTINSKIYANSTGIGPGTGHTVTGSLFSNGNAINATGVNASASVYSNSTGFWGPYLTIGGNVGFDPNNNQKDNTSDFSFVTYNSYGAINAKMKSAGPSLSYRNSTGSRGRLSCEHYNQTANSHKIFDVFGDMTTVTADGGGTRPYQRGGGNATVIETTTQSNCSATNVLKVLEHRVWATTGVSKTYRYYVQTDYAALSAAKIALIGSYLNAGSGGGQGTVTSTQAITTRSNGYDWSQYIEVTINPSQTGWVTLTINVMGYESGKFIYIDPLVVIS
jgi:hypothetical protein